MLKKSFKQAIKSLASQHPSLYIRYGTPLVENETNLRYIQKLVGYDSLHPHKYEKPATIKILFDNYSIFDIS
jgi:hypothetical protein